MKCHLAWALVTEENQLVLGPHGFAGTYHVLTDVVGISSSFLHVHSGFWANTDSGHGALGSK